MSDWKVFKTSIQVFPHPDPETTQLELGVAGNYPVVIKKGAYASGDMVVFIPEKSVLDGALRAEFQSWLVGPQKNRVKEITLRGAPSAGIIVDRDFLLSTTGIDMDNLPEDVDVSDILGIEKYIPKVPQHLDGLAQPLPEWANGIKHDVERHAVYSANGDYVPGERVLAFEKIHGSQINVMVLGDEMVVTTKAKMADGLCYVRDESNTYWAGATNSRLLELAQKNYPGKFVQMIGEVVPVQGGYNYGKESVCVMLFDLRVDHAPVLYDQIPADILELWVPLLYDGPLNDQVKKLALGSETVSGRSIHKKEGIVIQPYLERRAKDGTRLKTKVINPEYKETGEEFN